MTCIGLPTGIAVACRSAVVAVNLLSLTLLAGVNVVAAGFAHRHLPRFTAGSRRVLFTRLVLLGVGVAVDRAGALLVADDVGNVVWRVTPAAPAR